MRKLLAKNSNKNNFAACAVQFRFFTSLPSLVKPPGGKPSELPPLDYPLDAGIAPVFTPRQLNLHYTKHHKAYIDKLNALTAAMEDKTKFDGKPVEEIALAAHKDQNQPLFNQAAQHYNHSFFWRCLTPNGKKMPKALETALVDTFGSVDEFKSKFQQAALGNFGSGWTWLVYKPEEQRLDITNTSNAGFPLINGDRPIFTADVWEHAYYVDYVSQRGGYIEELWKSVNWEFVDAELKRAQK